MEENLNNNKLPYLPPAIEVLEYEVEQGFAKTSVNTLQMDTWSQINSYGDRQTLTGTYDSDLNRENYDAGQNYHGEWY